MGISINGGSPIAGWFIIYYNGKSIYKCMIQGYHHFRKPPYQEISAPCPARCRAPLQLARFHTWVFEWLKHDAFLGTDHVIPRVQFASVDQTISGSFKPCESWAHHWVYHLFYPFLILFSHPKYIVQMHSQSFFKDLLSPSFTSAWTVGLFPHLPIYQHVAKACPWDKRSKQLQCHLQRPQQRRACWLQCQKKWMWLKWGIAQ